jgi:hypothetical protein
MRRLTYTIHFIRPAGTTPQGGPEPIAASNVTISMMSVPGGATKTKKYDTAVLQASPRLNPDFTFTERGHVIFGKPAENNKLSFSSIGLGFMKAYECPEKPYTAGTVMWGIDSGDGFFAGATGAITANFLIDISKPGVPGELISYQFGVVYLP